MQNICGYGVSPIIKSVYLDLKKCYRKKLIKEIYSGFNIPYNTIYSWIVGQNPIPISKAYCLLNLWKDSFQISEEDFLEKCIKELNEKKIDVATCSLKIAENIAKKYKFKLKPELVEKGDLSFYYKGFYEETEEILMMKLY